MSLEKKIEQSHLVIHTLQKTIEQKEDKVKDILQKITAKESQIKRHEHKLDAADHTSVLLELEDMKRIIIQLEEDIYYASMQMKLTQEEATCYKKHAATLTKVCI